MKLMTYLFILTTFISCVDPNPMPGPQEKCTWVYNFTTKEWYQECNLYYYSQNGDSFEMDIAADVADKQQAVITSLAQIYQDKFTLSQESAHKMAKVIFDYNALSERTEDDMADFAQNLYGINPAEIISAVSEAQVGNNIQLEKLIEQASINLGTTTNTTKEIINELHGKILEENGINL